MPRAIWLLLAAVLTGAAIGGCGAEAGERSSGSISSHDMGVLDEIHSHARDWNKAAEPWVKAANSGDVDRFQRVHLDAIRPLDRASSSIESGAHQITDRALREAVLPIGAGYREEFEAMVDIAGASSTEEVDEALKSLRTALRRKSSAVNRLGDRFPELGRDF